MYGNISLEMLKPPDMIDLDAVVVGLAFEPCALGIKSRLPRCRGCNRYSGFENIKCEHVRLDRKAEKTLSRQWFDEKPATDFSSTSPLDSL